MEQQEKITHTEFMISERISAFFPKMSCPFGSTVVAPTYGLWFLFKALIKRIASPFDWLNSLIVAITQQMQFDWWLNLLICCANVDLSSCTLCLFESGIRYSGDSFVHWFTNFSCSMIEYWQVFYRYILHVMLLASLFISQIINCISLNMPFSHDLLLASHTIRSSMPHSSNTHARFIMRITQ